MGEIYGAVSLKMFKEFPFKWAILPGGSTVKEEIVMLIY